MNQKYINKWNNKTKYISKKSKKIECDYKHCVQSKIKQKLIW